MLTLECRYSLYSIMRRVIVIFSYFLVVTFNVTTSSPSKATQLLAICLFFLYNTSNKNIFRISVSTSKQRINRKYDQFLIDLLFYKTIRQVHVVLLVFKYVMLQLKSSMHFWYSRIEWIVVLTNTIPCRRYRWSMQFEITVVKSLYVPVARL